MRVSGFVMTDESGEVLAVSVGGSADLVKSLAAPESKQELVAEHERLVDVLRSPDHEDDLVEAEKQEAELAEYRGEDMAKAHVKGYTRKDGTFVKEHDDSRQAAQPQQPVSSMHSNRISDKHGEKFNRKESEWIHDGKKIPSADLDGVPEFSHKEVYGHDFGSAPTGNFLPNFVKQGHRSFILKHPDGKRSYVDNEGFGYARYHAPVEDAPAGVNSDDAFEQIKAAGGTDVTTTSGHINYTHNGQQKQLAHKDAADGHRYVDSGELEQHLADMKGGKDSGGYDHPNVVGKADFGSESPEKGWSMKFAGTEYTQTGKEGKSMHDETPVREFESADGHRVWADGAGRVHADSTDEVAGLRQKHEASQPKAAPKKAAPKKKAAAPKAAASAQADSNESGWDSLSDDENPRYALQMIGSGALGSVSRGEDDLNQRAKVELASRGLDSNGKWLGFKEAAKHHGVEVPKGDPDEVGSHMQLLHSAVLGAAARGELDLNKQAKHTLASRGHDSNGAWVGFDAAKKHHGIADKKSKPMAKSLLFVPAGGAAELVEMSKSIGAGSGD